MPLKLRVVALGLLVATPAVAGLFGDLAGDFTEGALEKIQPVLAGTLADVEVRATRLEDHIGDVAGGVVKDLNQAGAERLEQVDQILEARILQVRSVADQTIDHALTRVDALMQVTLAGAETAARNVVADISDKARALLADANRMLAARVADLGHEVESALGKADGILAARIAQVDETLERRLGNVDVIASKQRLALEATALRVAVLIGLVAFVIYVLRRLYGRYLALTKTETGFDRAAAAASVELIADPPAVRGPARTWMFVRGLGVPLLGDLLVGALGAGLVALLYATLPLGAQKESRELIETHETALAESLAVFDFSHARYHASQLELLEPEAAVKFRTVVARAELVRDVLERPTLLATDAGVADVRKRLAAAQRLSARLPDPDLLVVDALLAWQTGTSRADERRAAHLSARALRMRRGPGFALAPLAGAMVATYLAAPYGETDLAELRAALVLAPPDDARHPLAATVTIARLMREVDGQATAAYVRMVRAHADLVRGDESARDTRTAAARDVVAAWAALDDALLAVPAGAAVLAVFRLNDTTYSRARWFVLHPESNEVAPLLAADPKDKSAANRAARIAMAPPRLVWARRYRDLLGGPARTVLGLQEAERFAARERAARAFELAAAQDKPIEAARAAAHLGLYVGGVPVASQLSDDPDLTQALALRGVRIL